MLIHMAALFFQLIGFNEAEAITPRISADGVIMPAPLEALQ